ncbi:sigma-70 family RNA polymerase sigma factor [Streptomyces sp. NPDC088258]|uniref:sigma-70 family RNA polymerase sigma factor n=1 Tax=Streptomyces sp. NPDC088258 TaxID=3365849 RepID=UPI00380AB304
MSGDGRNEPLGGGGRGGSGRGGSGRGHGVEPGGTCAESGGVPPSEQVPSQGGPKGGSGPGGRDARAGQGEAEGGVPPQRGRTDVPPPADPPTLELTAVRATGGTAGPETPPADAELVQRMRDGDDSAYAELFRRHAGPVRRYARTCCRDADTADDLTAEVFARTLQAVRGGAGPRQAVRAYLLTTVRRVAATWTKSARREQLVEDFAVFAAQATDSSEMPEAETLELGADVLAMHEAERSMAVQAFRSLPERWQAVLWHTTVEEESPSQIAPLFGLSANATAVLASRAREGLKQAYLQAHVSASLTSAGDCSRYADRLGAYARGGLRMRAERGLRKHLEECARCRLAAGELAHVNSGIPALLPVAVIGWFAAGYSLKAAGIVAGGAVGAAGAGAAAAATGGSSAPGAASATGEAAGKAAGKAGGKAAAKAAGKARSEALGAPAKAGIAALVAAAVAGGLLWALSGGDHKPAPKPEAKPPVVQPVVPQEPPPFPEPSPPEPTPPSPTPAPASKPPVPTAPPAKPTPTPTPTPEPKPTPTPTPRPSAPAPPSAPSEPAPPPAETTPKPPSPTPAPAVYQVNQLSYSLTGDGSKPEVRLGESSWLWQRSAVSIGGTRYGHGVTTQGTASVTIDLNRSCSAYAALVGVDDLTLGRGSLRFSVYGDTERLWRSPVLSGGDAAVPVEVGISGRRTLRLVVEPSTAFDVVALADWAHSRISCR